MSTVGPLSNAKLRNARLAGYLMDDGEPFAESSFPFGGLGAQHSQRRP